MTRKFILAILLAFCSLSAVSGFTLDSLEQRVATHNRWCSPEKLYVHLDRTCYAAGETIWFNAYLKDANDKSAQRVSRFVYVELLDSCGNAILRHKIKRNEGTFPGNMYLPEDIRSGDYTFRAYTLWQMNRPSEYMFNQRLKISGAYPAPRKNYNQSSGMDISFYPEGGRYFDGVLSVMAFKAMDDMGRSLEITGSLYDDNGEYIKTVSTLFDGMGSFSFIPVEGHKYYLKISQGGRFYLPQTSRSGATIGVRTNRASLTANVCGISADSCILFIYNNGVASPLVSTAVSLKPRYFEIASEYLRPGINHLLLLDSRGRILSERKLFCYDDNTVVCRLDSLEISYKRCMPVKAGVSIVDSHGNPVSGKCSISVSRGSFKNFQQDDGIESYMNLSSEIKGHINNPYHYFDPDIPISQRRTEMDLLMLVQGWNYYDFENLTCSWEPFPINYLREYRQVVNGRISSVFRGKMPKNFSFSLFVPKLKITELIQVDQADAFTIDSLDFKENTEFFISINRNGFGRDYIPKWTGERFASGFRYSSAPGRGGSVSSEDVLPVMYEGVVVDTLSAAVVTATSDDNPFAETTPGLRISGEEIERFKDYTLVQYILYRTPRFEYDGDSMYNTSRRRETSTYASTADDSQEFATEDLEEYGRRRGEVRLVDDGTESMWWAYENVYMGDVLSLNISTMQDSFHNADGGLVALKLSPGVHVDRGMPESMLYFVPLGYQQPSAFYSPRYDKGDSHEIYDHRNTIYWVPDIKVTDGRASIEFCDTDQQDYPYYVRVEGLSENGIPFSGRAVIK